MAFDKIVGVDGTTYNLPDAVRTKISSNITTAGQQENTAVAQVVAAGITGKANTVHTHTVSQITDLTGIGSIPGVEIGVVGGNGIALADKHTLQYESSTSRWRNKVASGGVTVSETRPTTPIPGDAWFDSNDGTLYVYYTDVNTAQWVQVQANSALEGTILARLGAVEARATALEAVPDYSPNYIINGAFDIWQRGTSFTNINGYCADRWMAFNSGGVINVTRETFPVGQTDVDGNPSYFLKFAVTTGNDYARLVQRIEDVKTLSGKTVTVSFWAKGTNPGGGKVYIGYDQASGGTAGQSDYAAADITLTASWQRFSKTITIPALSGTVVDANSYMSIIFSQGADTSTAAWTMDIANVQVEVGSVATPFRRNANSIQGELAACQRYYYRATSTSAYGVIGTGKVYSTYNANIYIPFPVPMRAIPGTIDWNGVTAPFQMEWGATSTTITAVSLNSFTNNNRIGSIDVGSGGSMTVANYVVLLANNNTNAYVGFSAEL